MTWRAVSVVLRCLLVSNIMMFAFPTRAVRPSPMQTIGRVRAIHRLKF